MFSVCHNSCTDKTRTVHTKSDNPGIMFGNDTDEIITKLFNSLLSRYHIGLYYIDTI